MDREREITLQAEAEGRMGWEIAEKISLCRLVERTSIYKYIDMGERRVQSIQPEAL